MVQSLPQVQVHGTAGRGGGQILEGDVVVLVDNSPAAIILPTTLFDVMEEANDYYFPPITGSYLRLVRFLPPFSLPSLPRCGSC